MKSATVPMPSTTEPATAAQLVYLGKLMVWRGVTDIDVPTDLTEAEASALIDRVKAVPGTRRPGADVGFYIREGELYEVRERREGGTYAQLYRVKDGRARWKFMPGMVTTLTGTPPVDSATAAAFIANYATEGTSC